MSEEKQRGFGLMFEGLEQVLLSLERLEFEGIERVCMECYQPEGECTCGENIIWPISHTILRLRAKLNEKP